MSRSVALMADEVHINTANGNGREGVQLKLGTKSLGLWAKDLIPVLFIALIGVFLYLGQQNNRENLGRIAVQLGGFQQSQNTALMAVTAQLQAIKDVGITQRQVSLDTLKELMQGLQDQVDMQTETLRRLMLTMQYNQGRPPEQQIPLELPSPQRETPH